MGNENMRDRPENGAEDPLAELARLMAQEDDFAELLRQSPPARTAAPPQPPAAPSGRPMSPPPTRPPLTARRPTDEARPAPGSFAALAAEVYGEGVSRGAPPRPGSEYQAPDAHREPARGERPDPRAPYVPPRPQVTEAGRRMPAPNAAPSAPQRPLPTRPEAPRPEAPRAPSPRPTTAADMARQEALRQEALRQDALRQEASRPDLGRQDAARQEAARQEAARQEALRREALRQEAVRQDAARQDAARQDAARQEAARQQAARQESARREAAAQAAAAPSAGGGDEAADTRIPAWMTRATAAARAVDAPTPAAPPAGSVVQGRSTSVQHPVDLDEDAYDYGRSAGDYPAEADAYDDYAPEELAPKGLDRKRLLMIGGAVVVFIGAAAIGYSLMSGRSTSTVAGAPPVIRADQGPNKVVPNQPAAAEQSADGQKLIYDRVGGATTGNEQVVSSEEQPVDVSQAAQPQPRVIQTSPSSASQPGSGEPKRVRTLTVRADGTVVEVPAPAAPVPPGASAAPAGNPVALNMGAGGTVPTSPTPLAATPSIVENMPADAAPAPAPAAAPRAATPAPAAPPARTAAAPAASSGASSVPAGAYVVQIASVRSEAEAQATWRSAQTRYADLLRGQPFSTKRADLGDKGIYYRAQVGNFSSRDGAVSLCEALRAQGTTCMVTRN